MSSNWKRSFIRKNSSTLFSNTSSSIWKSTWDRRETSHFQENKLRASSTKSSKRSFTSISIASSTETWSLKIYSSIVQARTLSLLISVSQERSAYRSKLTHTRLSRSGTGAPKSSLVRKPMLLVLTSGLPAASSPRCSREDLFSWAIVKSTKYSKSSRSWELPTRATGQMPWSCQISKRRSQSLREWLWSSILQHWANLRLTFCLASSL